jgi:flagellar protein FlaG
MEVVPMAMEALNIIEGNTTYTAPSAQNQQAAPEKINNAAKNSAADSSETKKTNKANASDDLVFKNIEQAALERSKNGNIKDTNEVLKDAVEKLNENMTNTRTVYGVHEATDRIYIKLVDKDSDKVLKEYPPEELLDMMAKALELAGIIVDEKR